MFEERLKRSDRMLTTLLEYEKKPDLVSEVKD